MLIRYILLISTTVLISGCSLLFGTKQTEPLPPTETLAPVPTFTPTPEQARLTEIPTNTPQIVEVVSVADSNQDESEIDTGEVDTSTADESPKEEPTSTVEPTLTPTIEPTVEIVESPTESIEPRLLIAIEIINVRGGPGTLYDIIGSASAQQEFPIVGRNEAGDWWQVCCFNGDQPGWLYGPLVDTQNTESVAVAANIPELPTATPAPVVVEESPAEPEPAEPEPAVAEEVVAEEVATEPEPVVEAAPGPHSHTVGNFDPNAQFHIVHYKVRGFDENNGGIFNNGGQHMIFVNVIDENGQGINDAVVKDANNDKLHIVVGNKGAGRTEFEMFWEPYKLYVASIPGGPVTSQISNQMNTAKPHVPDIVGLMGPADNEYAICPTIDDRCEPPFFHAHWSYEITFQKVK